MRTSPCAGIVGTHRPLIRAEICLRSLLFTLNCPTPEPSQLKSSLRLFVHITMQCKLLTAFVFSFLAFAASAAPVPDSSKGLHILDREIDHSALVGMSDVARAADPEPEMESESARGCRMYSCI
ncbi:hypothetical protein FB451DRAFT_1557180 [Mycena latifolia]|nr:hypothetical protein FB451DRAFT_1557180 [Mycena latifolia]